MKIIGYRLVLICLVSIMLVGAILFFFPRAAQAQSDKDDWSAPTLLFQGKGSIYTPAMFVGQAGEVNVIWQYVDTDGNQVIYSTGSAGEEWSVPIDIIFNSTARNPRITQTLDGSLHMIWLGSNGQLLYSYSPPEGSNNARYWSTPVALAASNNSADIVVDSAGGLHVVYPGSLDTGVFYMYSIDSGKSWSSSVNIAASARTDTSTDYTRIAVSNDGTLHIVWTEFQLPEAWPPTGVYYSHSSDSGETWSPAVQIAGPGYDQINVALVGDGEVHLAWNGMAGVGGRYHRWSIDGGTTWSDMNIILPPPEAGTTGPPQLVIDSAGTLHALLSDGPQYSVWDDYSWSIPVNIAGEKASASGFIEEAIMGISEGNRLHVVFWDDRKRLWYTSHQTDAPMLPPVPLPTIETTNALPNETGVPLTTSTPVRQLFIVDGDSTDMGQPDTTKLGQSIFIAILPSLVLVLATIAIYTTVLKSRR